MYAKLTRAELIERLHAVERERAGEGASPSQVLERERLLQELSIHQVELEAQNVALCEAHDELHASRSRYANLYDFAPISYCTFDRSGIVVEINLTGAKLLGQRAQDLIGKPFLLVARIAHPGTFFDHLERSLHSTVPVITELTVKTENEQGKEFQLVSSAVTAPNGDTTIRTAFLDVSAQRSAEREARAEKAVRARLDALERVAAAASQALANLSLDDPASFLQVVADEARAALSSRVVALSVEADSEAWVFSGASGAELESLKRMLLGPWQLSANILSVPIRWQAHDCAHLFFIDKLGAPAFTTEDQRLADLLADRIGVTLETARLRRAEMEQRAAAELLAERLSSVIENSEDALALYDAQQRLVLCNQPFRTLLHDAQLELEPQTRYREIVEAAAALVGLADAEERARFCCARLASDAVSERLDVRLRDGRSLRVRNRPTREGGMVQTISDLTEDAARERELSEAQKAAEQASAAKTEFLSSVSHELRTPLNAVLGFTQLLRRDRREPLSERHLERLQHIERGGEHLLQLIDDVLDLSRIEAGRTKVSIARIQLSELLSDVETTLAPMANKAGIDVSVCGAARPWPPVLADYTRCKQVLMNFGTNAIKYGRSGGKVEFRVTPLEAFVRIAVEDDGLGIPGDKQATIFQPFQRAGRETGPIEGTGIGLAIAKRLTELMGGHIGFRSQEGGGSEFWLELPLEPSAVTPSSGANTKHDAACPARLDGGRARVLYIEDNADSAELIRDVLRDFEDVELLSTSTAEEGLELVQAQRPDLVLMDLNLPGISGLEAARRLRDAPRTQTLPLVALTAAAMPSDIARIERAGFDRHLTKPFDVEILLRILQDLLHRER